MGFYDHQFTGVIERHSMGHNRHGELFYTVVFVPETITALLPMKRYPRLRIDGEIDAWPFEGALHPAKGKRWYLLLSQRFLNDAALSPGDEVDVRFTIGDQNLVDMPIELERALATNETAAERWGGFTPGKQRGFAAIVSSAKQRSTREQRARKVLGLILDGKNPGGR